MAFVAKKITKSLFSKNVVIISLCITYFVVRIFKITQLPIFNDEAIYLNWGYKSLHSPNSLFYSLFDAKQPLLVWIFGISELFISEPLMSGRLISVAAGFLTLLGIYFLGKEFFNKKIALVAVVFYIITPLFVFFDRQALMESAIAAIYVWSCYAFVKLGEKQLLKWSFVLGIVVGVGFLIKSNSLIFIITAVILSVLRLFSTKNGKNRIVKNVVYAFFVAILINVIVFTQQAFWQTLQTNNRYSLTITEFLSFPFSHWLKNSKNLLEIGFWHITPIVFIVALLTSFFILKKESGQKKMIVYWFFVNILLLIVVSRTLSARYVISFFPIIPLFFSYGIFLLWKKQKILSCLVIILGGNIAVGFTHLLLFFPLSYFSTLNRFTIFSQKNEYVTDWPAGFGINETVVMLKKISQNKKIYVGVRPDSGNPEDAIFAYFNTSRYVKPTYVSAQLIKPWIKDNCVQTNREFYFVSRDNQLAGLESMIEKKIGKIYKPEGKSFIALYKLKTKCKIK